MFLLLLLFLPSVCFSGAALMGEESLTYSSVDFACYFEGTWSDPTYTMDEILDVDDGDTTGTKESSSTISTTQAYSGTHSLYIPSNNDSLNFDFTDRPSEFTIDLYVYLPAISANNQFFEIYVNDQNRYRGHIQSDGAVGVEYVANGTWVTFITTATVSAAIWTHIEITNSVANDNLGVRIADGSWEDYSGANTVGSFSVDPTTIGIGSNSLSVANGLYIDDFKYKKSYEVH